MKNQITLLTIALLMTAFSFGQASSTGSGSSTTMMQNKSNGTSAKTSTIRVESGSTVNEGTLKSVNGTKTATVQSSCPSSAIPISRLDASDGTTSKQSTLQAIPANVFVSAENDASQKYGTAIVNSDSLELKSRDENTEVYSKLLIKPTQMVFGSVGNSGNYTSVAVSQSQISNVVIPNTDIFTVSSLTGTGYSMGVRAYPTPSQISTLDLQKNSISLTKKKPSFPNITGSLNFVEESDGYIGVFETGYTSNGKTYGHSTHNNMDFKSAEIYEFDPEYGMDTKFIGADAFKIRNTILYDLVDSDNFTRNDIFVDENGVSIEVANSVVSGVESGAKTKQTMTPLQSELIVTNGTETNTNISTSQSSAVLVENGSNSSGYDIQDDKIEFSSTDGTNTSTKSQTPTAYTVTLGGDEAYYTATVGTPSGTSRFIMDPLELADGTLWDTYDGTNTTSIKLQPTSAVTTVTDGTVENEISFSNSANYLDFYSGDGDEMTEIYNDATEVNLNYTKPDGAIYSNLKVKDSGIAGYVQSDGLGTLKSEFNMSENMISSVVRNSLGNTTINQDASNVTTTAETVYQYAGATSLELSNTSTLVQSPAINLEGTVTITAPNAFITDAGTTYKVAKVLSGSATLDFPSTLAGATSALTVTVTGASTGDFVQVNLTSGTNPSTGVFWAKITATNTATVYFVNTDPINAVNPPSATFVVIDTKL